MRTRTTWLAIAAVGWSLMVAAFSSTAIADNPDRKPADDAQQRLQLERIKAEQVLEAQKARQAALQKAQAERQRRPADAEPNSDDDFDDLPGDAVVPEPGVPRPVPVPMGQAQVSFAKTVFGGYQGDAFGAAGNQLEFLLQARLSTADLVCSLAEIQKQKLQLAGRGDIKHLLEQIRIQKRKCELLDDGAWQGVAGDVIRQAQALRDLLEVGPFGEGSMFAKSLARALTSAQRLQYEKYQSLERLGGRIHLRPRGDDEIKALRMTKATLVDEGLAPLAGMTGLKSLNLDYTQITDAGMAHLAGLTSLELLELEGTQVKGPGLAHLRGMQSLQMLDLRRTGVDDAALAHLRPLESLRVLQLAHTRVAGRGLAHLAGLRQLETLLLVQTQVDDAGLAGLAGMTNLKEVNLEGTQITDAGLPQIAQLSGLVTLDLRRTRVTDAGLAHLHSLKRLQAVYLFGTQVSAKGAEELERLMPDTRVVR
ncbi:MAG: hypothetical protein HY290_03590 [Planctomycetia bacterium]|nr:hypothetical protein [Planctomycetia bacterium]